MKLDASRGVASTAGLSAATRPWWSQIHSAIRSVAVRPGRGTPEPRPRQRSSSDVRWYHSIHPNRAQDVPDLGGTCTLSAASRSSAVTSVRSVWSEGPDGNEGSASRGRRPYHDAGLGPLWDFSGGVAFGERLVGASTVSTRFWMPNVFQRIPFDDAAGSALFIILRPSNGSVSRFPARSGSTRFRPVDTGFGSSIRRLEREQASAAVRTSSVARRGLLQRHQIAPYPRPSSAPKSTPSNTAARSSIGGRMTGDAHPVVPDPYRRHRLH